MNLYGHKVNQLGRSFQKELNEQLSLKGLFSSQWAIILYLYNNEDSTQVDIGNYLKVEAPTITRTLSRMEKYGWISRREGHDKRQKLISLTDKAINKYDEWKAISDGIEAKAAKDISPEDLDIFNKVLDRMMDNLD